MKDPRIQFDTRTPFARALRERVAAYFEASGRSRSGGSRMVLKTSILFAWLVIGYVGLFVFAGSWLAMIAIGLSCGLAMAGLGMAVQHDGGHRSYSGNGLVNKLAASVLDLLGASSYVWRIKHGVAHHTYPNIDGADDDIEAGAFARLSPGQRHRFVHRFQHLYIWVLYAALTIKWFWIDDFVNLGRGRVGSQPLQRPRGVDLLIFVTGKLAHLSWALIVPIAVLGWGPALVFYAAMSAACGVTLAVVFQLAHCVEEAEFPTPDPAVKVDFAAHQLATTVDFARGNAVLSWYVGGLNFQAVHHLFPRVSHLHYPALAPIIEATAAEFGVRYSATASIGRALRSHYRWLRTMGQAPA